MKKLLLIAATVFSLSSGVAMAAGAIAVDDQEGDAGGSAGYGFATGDASEVSKDAIKLCKESGNKSCEVVLKFGDGKCGAYASSKKYSGTGVASSKSAAAAKALEECGSGCKLVVSDCDD